MKSNFLQFTQAFSFLCLAMALAGFEVVTRWYLGAGSGKRDPGRVPPLLDALHPAYSVAFQAPQFYAAVLFCKHRASQLLWKAVGATSCTRMIVAFPRLAHKARTALVAASVWMFLRNWARLQKLPWLLGRLCDTRIPYNERWCMAMKFWFAPACDMDFYFSLRLRNRLQEALDILGKFYIDFLYYWCWSYDLGTADVEDRHARNKAHCGLGTTETMLEH